MNIEKEILDSREAVIKVTLDDQQWQRALKDAARRISKQANIPGFRKGKAPYRIIQQYFGDGVIIEEALDPLTQETYRKVLEEEDIEPYAMGALTNVDFEPTVFTYRIPLPPVIELGDYRSVRIPYEEEEVTDEDVEKVLQDVREQQATLEAVEEEDTPVEWGMAAALELHGTIEGPYDDEPEEWLEEEDIRVLIAEDSTYPVPGFPPQIVGMKPGDEKSFDIKVEEGDEDTPEEYHGKTLHFEVTCNEVFTYDVPELDDELAQSVSEFETLEELRADIRDHLEKTHRRNARDDYLGEVFEELGDIVKVSFPPVIVEEEIDAMMERFDREVRQQGLTLEDYISINDLTEEEIREDFQETAEQRVRRGLILGQILEEEEITVSEEEVDDEIQDMLLSFGGEAAMAQSFFKGESGRNPIRSRLLTQKAVDQLIAIARGEAENTTEEETPEEEADSADSDNE